MDNRFLSQQGDQQIQNGGMFTREQIQRLSQQIMQMYGSGSQNELEPADLARCMIDTYRGMNKHFIPTGYELSSFARVFDQSRKGKITSEDILATATRMFLANKSDNAPLRR